MVPLRPPVPSRFGLDHRHSATRLALACLAIAVALLAGGCTPKRKAPRPSVLLLTIDTLRADHLSAWGYPRATSPILDQLAAEGVRFELAQTQWPKTGPSFASMMTATYGKDNGIVREIGKPLPCGFRTLAEELKALGYETSAVVANGAVGREFYFDQGFDRYAEAWKGAQGDDAIEVATRPDHVTHLALEALARLPSDKPFFLWVHYLDPHFPYRPPEPWRDEFQGDAVYKPEPKIVLDRTKAKRVTGAIGRTQILDDRDDLGFYIARYDAEIKFTDHEIGRLIDELKKRGLWDRMLTVFTSDHGESLGDHGYYFDHGMLPFQDVLHVPLAIRYPGTIAPRVDPHPVELLHLAPTILDYAGAKLRQGVWGQGRSLADRLEGRADGRGTLAFSEAGYETNRKWMTSVTDGRLKLVWAQRAIDQGRLAGGRGVDRVLYDIRADPGETVDVSSRFPAEFAALEKSLWTWYNEPRFEVERPGEICKDVRTADPQTIEQLKALGYL